MFGLKKTNKLIDDIVTGGTLFFIIEEGVSFYVKLSE